MVRFRQWSPGFGSSTSRPNPLGRIFALALVMTVATISLAGCTRTPAGPTNNAGLQTPQELLSNAMATLRVENPNVTTYRSAVQQLNNYLDQKPELRDAFVLSEADKNAIRSELGLDLRDERGAEIERKSFTPLDAFHLEANLLFRDAVRSLQLLVGPEPARAADRDEYQKKLALLAFEWMNRQVQLQPRIRGTDDPRAAEIVRRFSEMDRDQLTLLGVRDVNDALGRGFWPAHEVLRRGTGDAEECSRIFLALLQQLKIPAGVVTRSIEVQSGDKTEKREITWLVGAVIGKDLYLFDPLLGRAVAGPEGKGVATLKQAQSDPAILKEHYKAVEADPEQRQFLALCQYDSSHPVVTTPAMIAKPSLYVLSNLSALAPRMKDLEGWLADDGNSAVLYEDLEDRLKTLRGMDLGVQVSAWRTRGGYPTTILAQFIEDPLNDIRRTALLSPRSSYIPPWVHQIAAEMRSPQRTREMFSRFDNYVLRIRLEPGGARDLLVRGRPEIAVEKILETQYNLDKTMEVLRDNMDSVRLNRMMRETWGPEAVRLVAKLNDLKVQEQKAPANSELQRQLRDQIRLEEQRFDAVWKENRVNMGFLTVEWAEPLVREHLTYFMALAKMELAVRSELQSAGKNDAPRSGDQLTSAQRWRSAEDWFDRYQALVLPQPRNHWAAAAEQHRATCQKARERLSASTRP